jgi:RNA ligase (TIGR02306 family)
MNFRKYPDLFEDGEEVILTEKTHGSSARFVCIDDQIYCGSHRFWKKENQDDLWWKALSQCPVLESWLRHNQNLGVYGEVFGQVQNLRYGANQGQIFFAAFDIIRGNHWLDYDEARKIGAPLPWVPLVYRGQYNKEQTLAFAEGDSLYPSAQNIREGVVLKPVHERTNHKIGRVQMKIVSNQYLLKS